MSSILLIATAYLCKDGLTEILLRCAKAASEHRVGIALAEGCDAAVEHELRGLAEIHELPSRRKKLPLYITALARLIAKEHYDTVHIHGNSGTMAFDLIAACMGGAKNRITHAHNCAEQPKLKKMILGGLVNRLNTCPVACSEAAGNMLYTRPFTVLTNGVDCQRFAYSLEKRLEVRERLGLDDAFVVGHVGRFTPQKNHGRLLHIFARLVQIRPDAKLLLCGEGDGMEDCFRLAQELQISDNVLFLGKVECPEDYYQAMDVFVLPSLFEGLPLVGVEAQACGLPCVFSDSITREVRLLPESTFVSLDALDEVWVKAISEIQYPERANAADEVAKAGFTETALQQQIQNLYDRMAT